MSLYDRFRWDEFNLFGYTVMHRPLRRRHPVISCIPEDLLNRAGWEKLMEIDDQSAM